MKRIDAAIRDVHDFPKPGIVFKDITPVLGDGELFRLTTDSFSDTLNGESVSKVIGIDARGFIFGAALAQEMGIGFTLVRKPGKLPRATRSASYELEYGTDELHMHADGLSSADRVVVVDDVLATGGTAEACARLVESTGATIHEFAFLMELSFLPGRDKLGARDAYAVLSY